MISLDSETTLDFDNSLNYAAGYWAATDNRESIETEGATVDQLRERHQQLDLHFANNPNGNSDDPGHRFFIDHQISEEELPSLRELVQRGLLCRSLDTIDWQTAYLPLLICAVEVGYAYEGNGTDFWPKLSETLGYDFDPEDRERISRWFARASEKYGAVTPGNSQWESAFRHIAWPITHAVAAKDIRRPFADCLRRFRRDVKSDSLKDETIVGDLSQISTPVGSRRFRTWLERPAVVAGIVRDLLGGTPLDEAGLFSKLLRERLIVDLRGEPEIRRAVRQVETRRVRKPRGGTSTAGAESQREFVFGSFFLCQNELGGFELCGEMPDLPRSVQQALKPIRRRWKVRPWGFAGALPIPSDCLRSARGHFPVSFNYVARAGPEAPFFTGVEEQAIAEEAKRWLERVRFPTGKMLAFASLALGDDSSHCIIGRTPHRGKIWVLARNGEVAAKRPAEDQSYCREVGQIEGGEIYEFDADNPHVREWLGWPLTTAKASDNPIGFTWLRPTPVAIDSADFPIFTTDDEIGVSVDAGAPVTLVLRQGSKEIARDVVSEIAIVSIESKGSYSLTLMREERELESFNFGIVDDFGDGFIEPDPETPWRAMVTHVDAGEAELSRSDLFNRRLALDVIGERGIDNLESRLSLSPGGATATIRLDRVPTRLSANHPIWDRLIRSLPVTIMKSPCDLVLTVEIEGLSHDSWRLESEIEQLWWEDTETGLPIAVNDNGQFSVRHYCLVENVAIEKLSEGDPFLSVASNANGNELHFDARIGLVGDSTLSRSLRPPGRFLRQMDDLDAHPGLRSIAHRYLQVSSASSSSLGAEINRVGAVNTLRSWLVRCLCGPSWYHKSQELYFLETISPIAIWWKYQAEQDDLLQPLSEESRHLPASLPDLVLAEFANVLPERWWDGIVAEVEPDDAMRLDEIYRHLLDDDSVYVDAEALTLSLRHANERLCGAALADLIIPSIGGDELLGWQLADSSVSDLGEQFHSWVRRHLRRGRGRQSWTTSELVAYLNLLLFPERLRKQSWEAVLEKLLHDRCVARAGAFIAWRVRQHARFESSNEQLETSLP